MPRRPAPHLRLMYTGRSERHPILSSLLVRLSTSGVHASGLLPDHGRFYGSRHVAWPLRVCELQEEGEPCNAEERAVERPTREATTTGRCIRCPPSASNGAFSASLCKRTETLKHAIRSLLDENSRVEKPKPRRVRSSGANTAQGLQRHCVLLTGHSAALPDRSAVERHCITGGT